MSKSEKKTARKENKTGNTFTKNLEQGLPTVVFLCLLCSLTLLLYQIHLNGTARETLESLTATVPTVRWYEEETDTLTIPTENATDAPAAVQSVSTVQNGKTYVLNTSSKKIHSPTCRYAISMNSENKDTVENVSLEELLAQGYSVCSVCNAEG